MKKQSGTLNALASSNLFIKHRPPWLSSPKIIPFIGFGNKNHTYIEGFVVEENGIARPEEGQPKLKNIKAMLKRYFSNEIEDIEVKVTYLGMSQVVSTDKYGIFRCHFQHSESGPEGVWQKVSVSLPGLVDRSDVIESAEGEVMMIRNHPQFGVISDIDDTILVSYAAHKLMKIRLMLLNNAHTRMPFEGVAAFYNALQVGSMNDGFNPIFYVSNSEWNLYDLLYEFIEFNRIPKGPLILRELIIRYWRPWKMKEVNKNHKVEVIGKLFATYPEMKFILIGDSGQKDPEVYSNIVQQFPGRVLAIYIRDVGIDEKIPKISIISQRVKDEFKTEMVLVKDTEAAAMHALKNGFISGDQIPSILKEKQKDIQKKDKPEEKLI